VQRQPIVNHEIKRSVGDSDVINLSRIEREESLGNKGEMEEEFL